MSDTHLRWLERATLRTPAVAALRCLSAALALVIPVGAAIAGTVYTADEHGASVSAIDTASGRVRTESLAVAPHNVQITPDGKRLLLTGMPADAHAGHGVSNGGGRLLVLDPVTLAVEADIGIGGHPGHVVTDGAGTTAYVADAERNQILAVDLGSGKVVASMPTGAYPHGLRASPDGRELYVADVKGGSVSVLDLATQARVATIAVGKAPVQVAFAPDGRKAYVSLRDEDAVAEIDTASRKLTARIKVGRKPIQLYATPDGRKLYVANQGTSAKPDDRVSVIDLSIGKVVATLKSGRGAHGVVAAQGSAWISNIEDGNVAEIDTATEQVRKRYPVGKGPNGITYRP